ncbi:hypothetical protein [Micromonospora sp. WMMD1082]|uniref:hypothetical protein n=1 Tax=Micromonospora sp. WMMD1082 TaxID=3016104 RepID=UPI0024172FA9|nr:hypothetical protein [Micromonospora sp. WMMD1082]MDG4793986.1 hypothetical protein [Micromonospora sp. WMMD1082]
MAHRTSIRLLFTALGVSLLAGAGQLGLAFGFGIVRLTGTFTGVSVNQWPAQLVWAGWFATNAAVIGAVLTERLARHDGRLTGTTRQLAVAGGAALGATVVAPLCMQPARSAELISVDPVWAVAICAGLGAVIGAGAALAVLVRPPFAWNMAAVAAVVWLLALLSVLPSLGASGPLTPVRLGVLEPAWLSADAAQRLALLILPLVTLLAGAATAALARRRGHPPLVSGPSGAAGPVLVAFAYLAAGPGDAGDRYQLTPYYGALIAVVVGALGSAAAALLPWAAGERPATGTAIEPTDILQPLPATPALPSAAHAPAGTESTTDSVIVVSGDTGAGPASDGAPARANPHATGVEDAPPPHWHWPAARTDAPTATTEPDTGATATPAPAAAAPADVPANGGRPDGGTPAGDSVQATNGGQATNSGQATDGGQATKAARSADNAQAANGGQAGEAAAGTGRGSEPASGQSPVGDGSDIRPVVRATQPAEEPPASPTPTRKAPTPRRTGKPRTPAAAPSTADAPAAADPAPTATTDPEPAPLAGAAPVAGAAPADGVAGDGSGEEAAPRPRPRFPMPDLNRATTWDAFTPAHRQPAPPASGALPPADLAGPPDTDPASPPTADPAGPPDTDLASPSPTDLAGLPDPRAAEPAERRGGIGSADAGPTAADPEVTIEPAATARDLSVAFTKPPVARAEDVQPDREPEKGRRGLFRLGRSRSGEAVATPERDEPLPAQDEEYVDWVAGLGRPSTDDEPEPPKPRRSLRSTGRHHRD